MLQAENKPPEARERAQAAVKADPRSVAAHYTLGVLQDALRQRKEAMASFSEVLRLNPRAAAAQVQLSRLNLQEGAPDTAVTFAEGCAGQRAGQPRRACQPGARPDRPRDIARAEQEVAPLLKQFPNVGLVHALNGALRLQKKDLPAPAPRTRRRCR